MSTTGISNSLRDALLETWEKHAPRPFNPKAPSIRLHEATFGPDEIWEALQCLLTTQVTMGRRVFRFEADFQDHFGFRHATMSNSGSSANLLAVAALSNPAHPQRLQPGDEVIVPALSWSTTVWPLIQHGLVPVVVDIDPSTLNIDPNEVDRAIGPKTRGLMIVHVYGNPCDMTALTAIAKAKSLNLIEDCCEAIGATYGGASVGSFGQVGTFSFYYSHHITTLEGGMTVTADPELAELMRILRAHGWIRESGEHERHRRENPNIHPRFLFVNQGYNLRPTELQGAIGSVQLPKLQNFISLRTSNADYWSRQFSPYSELMAIQEVTQGGVSSWFGFPITVREGAPFEARDLILALESKGIETRPLICGNIAAQPGMRLYRHRIVGDLKHATRVMKSGFTFGNHQAIDASARAYVADCVHEFVANKGARLP